MLFRGLGVLPLFFFTILASTTELFGTTIVESCLTYLGTQQLCYVPTNTRTETVFESPAFASSTSIPLITTTLLPSTQTISSTKTITSTITDSTITDTFTSTSTIFSTIIDTTVLSQTFTITETLSSTITATTTTNKPTLTGFLPVSDTTASVYPEVLLRKKRELSHIRDLGILKNINQKSYGGLNAAQTQSIECIVSIEIRETFVNILTGKTQTKTITPTTTTIITILETSTSTLAPSASSTISLSTTLISTSTLTQTSTLFIATTSLDILTVTDTITSYAACGTSNILASIESTNISNIYNNGNGFDIYTSLLSDSVTDCCGICQETTDCESFSFAYATCFLFNRPSGSCPATDSTASQSGGPGVYVLDSDGIYTVGNGACGYLWNGGYDD